MSITGQVRSYALGVANNDNGNSSSVSINGQVVVSNNHCCENFWRRFDVMISSVSLATARCGRRGRRQLRLAVVADDVSVSGFTQTPAGGMSNNHPPIFSRLDPRVWTRVH